MALKLGLLALEPKRLMKSTNYVPSQGIWCFGDYGTAQWMASVALFLRWRFHFCTSPLALVLKRPVTAPRG
jgi:hypothetical protein